MDHWVAAKARWSLVTSQAGPSPRFGHTAVWGGQSFWVYAGSGEVLLNDLWAFDASTSTWTQSSQSRNHSLSSLSSPSHPPPVHRHAMVWDPGTEALWISGGFDGENFLKEVWKYYTGDAGRWFRIVDSTVPGPCARSDHVAMWDATTSALWIHGGFDGTALDDLWRFDSREGTWNKMPRVGHQPSARANHVAAFDGANRAIWIHAGHSGSPLLISFQILYSLMCWVLLM